MKQPQLTSLFLLAAFAIQFAQALHCQIGWPVLLGADNHDGDTEVTTWSETPEDGMFYIGGTSRSLTFTEQAAGTCDVKGCAFVTTWKKTNEKLANRLIYTGVQSIINIEYNSVSGNSAFLFMQATEDNKFYLTLTINKWILSADEPQYSFLMYKINEDFDYFAWDEFQRMAILTSNKLILTSNSPDEMTVTDYFFMLNDATIGNVYNETYKSANEAGILKASPTRKLNQGIGYDENNIIQLMTISIPRGEKEFGGVVTLGQPTTYMTVLSRKMGTTLSPFSVEDIAYAFQQESSQKYYYWSHFALSYRTNSSKRKVGDVKLFTVGSHSSKKFEVYFTMWEQKSTYKLEHEKSRKLVLDENVEIFGVGTDPDDDIHKVIVYYRQSAISQRGKVMITDMKDNTGVTTYDFMPAQIELSGNQQYTIVNEFRQSGYGEDQSLFYAGKANYLRGSGDALQIIVDWTDKNAYFGFFMVYTFEDHCLTSDDRLVTDYGPTYPTYYDEIDEIQYLRTKTAGPSLYAPTILLTQVDMDDEKYDEILKDKLRIDDGVDFNLERQDWAKPFGKSDKGTSQMLEITGKDWLRKYSSNNNGAFQVISRKGTLGIAMYGIIALLNVALSITVWFVYMATAYPCGENLAGFCLFSNDLWWYAWFSAFVVHIGLWTTVLVMWPVSYIGSYTPLLFLRVFCLFSLAGPYGLYEGVTVAMLFAFVINKDTSGHTARGWGATPGLVWTGSYFGWAVICGFIQIWFLPDINEWFYEVKKAEAAEEDTLEELGFFGDGDDSGPIIFNQEFF